MKVYIVTAGSYSDYHIAKVFTDEDKAEEYREWLYDSNDVEEYETEDDLQVDKYYKIQVIMRVHDDKNDKPMVSLWKECKANSYNRGYIFYTDYHKYGGDYFDISVSRLSEAQNWNEEFYTNRYTKALYDIVAIVKQKRAEGASESDIRTLLKGMEEQYEQ